MNKRLALLAVLVCLFGLGLVESAGAQILSAPTGPTSGAGLVLLIRNLTNWLFVGFLALASIFIILAAFQFLSGGGDPTQVSSAKKKLIFAAIAVIIATLSKGFVNVVISILGV